MKKTSNGILSLFIWIWKALTTVANLATNLVFLLVLLILVSMLLYESKPGIPDGSALLLAPEGTVVERRSAMDPMARVLNRIGGVETHEEILLQDILDGIDAAADDARIKLLVLSPSRLERVGFNQLKDIGRAIERFKKSGKIVIAADDGFNQAQYYLAAYADEIYMNPAGRVELLGFAVYRLYFKKLLEKLKISLHVFKVGEFKSALEPFLRENMSEEARTANLHWLNRLWQTYCGDIGRARGVPPRLINDFINNQDIFLAKTNGDGALAALNAGLVDGLKTRGEQEDYLSSLVGRGKNGSGYRHVTLYDYLDTLTPSYTVPTKNGDEIAVIVVSGNIVTGEGRVGQISADRLVRRLGEVRDDPDTRAVVLRIDSGGGSAFASELIRGALVRIQEAGKPVVVSMGSLAASGAYWLSADADAIIASPVTLTGSIGIFGALPDLARSLSDIGVHSDGVGTTSLAGGASPARELPPALARSMQLSVEYGYRQFLATVAKGRDMTVEEVEKIAEGRVWDGATAHELGLVDELGSLDDAVHRAAELAGIPDARGVYFDLPSGFLESLEAFGNQFSLTPASLNTPVRGLNTLARLFLGEFDFLLRKNDPGNLYAHSLLSPAIIDF